MDKDILTLISRDNSGFSKGQRLIAKYILENYDKAAFMTAGKLGKTVGVSESTVVRFAAELGFDGYPGMRKALQEMIRSRLTSVQRIEAAKDMLDDKNILKSVLSDDIDKLQTTLEEIDQDSFNRVVDSIIVANEIYIFASRTSRSLADFLAYYLSAAPGGASGGRQQRRRGLRAASSHRRGGSLYRLHLPAVFVPLRQGHGLCQRPRRVHRRTD